MSPLEHDRIRALPLIHSRVAFAIEARRLLLDERYDAVAVELPPSLEPAVSAALDALPRATAVVYREAPAFMDTDADPTLYFVPVHPGDGIVEALRIARGERIPAYYVDAEVEAFAGSSVTLPDPHALHALGLERYVASCGPALALHQRTIEDAVRESHMAACLRRITARHSGRVLFLCGMAHWRPVRERLESGDHEEHAGLELAPDQIGLCAPDAGSIPILMGDLPFIVDAWEEHRSGLALDVFDPSTVLGRLLVQARERFLARFPGSLETPDPQALRVLLDYARKMTVRRGYLIPDSYALAVAAHGVVGNDFAIVLTELANRYTPNGELRLTTQNPSPRDDSPRGDIRDDDGNDDDHGDDDGAGDHDDADAGSLEPITIRRNGGALGGVEVELRRRTPGTAFGEGRLQLERRPDPRRSRRWRTAWDPTSQCSYEPEDLVIEGFRDYVGRRALSLARVAQSRTHPFTCSLLDGIDVRETLRDVVERKVHVREERRTPGGVGALVVIFEEDDFGERYPWRTTWYAEHHNESTLAFYATDFLQDLIAPGIARSHYGGFLMIFPPVLIPDLWDDLRFERARTPSERLLLAGLYWSKEHYLVHVSQRPPAAAVKQEAARRGKHILHLPLATFSRRTLERLRRVHVLNGKHVRSWANRFIR